MELLEAAHLAAMHALGTATTGGQALIADYAAKVQEYASAIVGQTKAEALASAERAREAAKQKTESGGSQLHSCIDQIMIALRLPVSSSDIVMDFTDSADFQSIQRFPDGIATAYALSVDHLDDWKKPRRVSDFASGVSLPVGLKRSLFKRTVSHEAVALDEFFIGGFDLGDETAQLRLRRKPDQKDALVFDMRYTDSGFYAEVQHPNEADTSSLEPVLEQASAVELERLVMMLRSAAGQVEQAQEPRARRDDSRARRVRGSPRRAVDQDDHHAPRADGRGDRAPQHEPRRAHAEDGRRRRQAPRDLREEGGAHREDRHGAGDRARDVRPAAHGARDHSGHRAATQRALITGAARTSR